MLKADVEVDRRDFTVRAVIEVAPGERLALFGPSGAGKTTLLETIAGLVQPRTGTVELAGRTLTRMTLPRVAVPPWQRGIGLLRDQADIGEKLTRAIRAAPRSANKVTPWMGAEVRSFNPSSIRSERPRYLSCFP